MTTQTTWTTWTILISTTSSSRLRTMLRARLRSSPSTFVTAQIKWRTWTILILRSSIQTKALANLIMIAYLLP
ncbi:hypothetical protein C7974DRAFT_398646 [Boeremia exigua]|uniref:uncharacterized protein n=1 Tax=Boeremia exigua TaxID=749465 RepID=UPI001E8CDB6B|nr:uncharacterized protein C7974DRAFT_398646 [Boeremia exigua]KAH6619996.1 hypothetical protein C7974DRAFT_398646 [Boeremia exigua]